MKEIGEYLKAARIGNGVSLEEAADDLNLSVIQLENIEDGNVRAFKDVFVLRDLVKEYGKYLGVATDEIIDEFNDFMFEHTSKISLDDIKEARKIANEKELDEKPKITSPYTNIPKEKFSLDTKIVKYIFTGIVVLLLALIAIFIIIKVNSQEDIISSELKGRELNYYEFTY